MHFSPEQALRLARETLDIESAAILGLKSRLTPQGFARAVELMLACQGRVVVMGMGKSGHVGRKVAATLASTGTPALFVHPAEASHGDLGMIQPQDVALAISNSGESAELNAILPLIKRMGAPLVAMTGQPHSTLAGCADVLLDSGVAREACPLNLAPTASTTAQLALGDALAVALLNARSFTRGDFALSHPAGSLGRRLLLTVADVMHSGDALPAVAEGTPLKTAVVAMSEKSLGMLAVIDKQGSLKGIFTDGDLRRLLETRDTLAGLTVDEIMKPDPVTIAPDKLAAEAAKLMQQKRIGGLLVSEQGRLVGALNMHDLLRERVV